MSKKALRGSSRSQLGFPDGCILKNPWSSLRAAVILHVWSPTTGFFIPASPAFSTPRILEETLNSNDLPAKSWQQDESGCQAWNFYERKQNKNTTSIFWPHISPWSRSADPGSAASGGDAHRVSGCAGRWIWLFFCRFYLLLLHVTVCFMLLTKNVKLGQERSGISNWKMFRR